MQSRHVMGSERQDAAARSAPEGSQGGRSSRSRRPRRSVGAARAGRAAAGGSRRDTRAKRVPAGMWDQARRWRPRGPACRARRTGPGPGAVQGRGGGLRGVHQVTSGRAARRSGCGGWSAGRVARGGPAPRSCRTGASLDRDLGTGQAEAGEQGPETSQRLPLISGAHLLAAPDGRGQQHPAVDRAARRGGPRASSARRRPCSRPSHRAGCRGSACAQQGQHGGGVVGHAAAPPAQ